MIDWINGFQIGVSIVKIMCNPALKDRHWQQMSEIAGCSVDYFGTILEKHTFLMIQHL